MIVHEIEPNVFVRFPSGHPVIRLSTVETVIVRREDGTVTQQDRACAPYPVRVKPPEVALAWPKAEREAVGLFEVTPFTPPQGKQRVGEPSYARDGDRVVEVFAVEDVPPPPTRDDKIARMLAGHGLSVLDLRAALEEAGARP
jgi:hypothetical protein